MVKSCLNGKIKKVQMNLKNSFLQLCKDKKFEKNQNQLEIIKLFR